MVKGISRLKNFPIRRLIFLVKDVRTSATFFTQYFKPDVRPLKAYYQCFDVTKFLVSKNTLSNFTYQFLSTEASIFGFSVSEIRAFFKVQNKCSTKLVRKHFRSRSGIGFKSSEKKQPFIQGETLNPIVCPRSLDGVASREARLDQPVEGGSLQSKKRSLSPDLDDLPLKFRLTSSDTVGKSVSPVLRDTTPKTEELASQYKMFNLPSPFEKPIVFSDALKLLAYQSLPTLKFPLDELEYFVRLNEAGFGPDVLQKFQQYLILKYPSFSDRYQTSILPRLVSCFGYRLGGGELCYHLKDRYFPKFIKLDLI